MKKSSRKYNILMITTDQERVDLPDSLPLPAHERLRARGLSFSNYHVTTTPCGPSRSVIYTGLHTKHTGMIANPNTPPNPNLPTDIETLGSMLRSLGYETCYKGKWHISHIEGENKPRVYPVTSDALEPYGFADYNYDGDEHGEAWTGYKRDHAYAADAAGWIHNHSNQEKPWFLTVNFVNPHDIMFFTTGAHQTATRASPNMISPLKEAPFDPEYRIDWKFPLPRSFYEDDLSGKPWAQQEDVVHCNAFYGEMKREDEDVWHIYQNFYFNALRDVDRRIGLVLDALEESGETENTIVIFTADHGEMAGAHGLRQKGPSFYRENVCVPLVIVHPDGRKGETTDALATSLDLAPTVLSFADISDEERRDKHPALKGCDLSTVVKDAKARSQRDERGVLFYYGVSLYWDTELVRGVLTMDSGGQLPSALAERLRKGEFPILHNRALIRGFFDGRYRFARYFAPAEHHTPDDWNTLARHNDLELYDTLADPDEITNLANDPDKHADLIVSLNEKLNKALGKEVGVDDGSEYAGDPAQYLLDA